MYTTETYKNPFWAENSGFMTGRDPLGVQNSSITTYGRLLPGMTNLTLRLRYYGFYLWLLSEFDKMVSSKTEKNLKNHFNFIRRAELTVGFIMRKKYPDELSIIGSNYTAMKENEVLEYGFYDIKLGADKIQNTGQEDVYWEFPSGALGQYYAGSLISLGLISISEKFFIIELEGQKLASAFASSIPEAQLSRFLKIISLGLLTIDDINNLDGFCINKIKPNLNEWNYYQNICRRPRI
ncbi:MAG TPA: hypothetical protein VFT78_09135 [Hanamia sp.]|nr:hypothetical protein [Hanamia sp.]